MTAGIVRLHVGAHKTASTYIQETLLLNRSQSAAAGVAYWPLHTARTALRAAAAEEKDRDGAGWTLPWNKSGQPGAPALARLRAMFLEGRDVTISEENILGNADDCYKGVFYRRAPQTLGLLGGLLKDRTVQVFLCVRSYAPFLASLYAESLRHGMFTRPDKMMAVNKSCQGQWPQIIDAVRAALPHAEIFMWPYEGFSRLEDDILSRLSGLAAGDIQKPSAQDVLPSASKKAIEQMTAQAEDLAPNQRIFKMLALQAQYPRGADNPGRFMPWSDGDQARLQSEYETDLAAIAARCDVTMLG